MLKQTVLFVSYLPFKCVCVCVWGGFGLFVNEQNRTIFKLLTCTFIHCHTFCSIPVNFIFLFSAHFELTNRYANNRNPLIFLINSKDIDHYFINVPPCVRQRYNNMLFFRHIFVYVKNIFDEHWVEHIFIFNFVIPREPYADDQYSNKIS